MLRHAGVGQPRPHCGALRLLGLRTPVVALDEAEISASSRTSVSARYYISESWYQHGAGDDVALIELREPLGLAVGWAGIGFDESDSFFESNVFHKLSYPTGSPFLDTTLVYDGRTLYYNYGTLDLVTDNWLGFGQVGVPGQSGSGLFHWDNPSCTVYGTLSTAWQSKHIRFSSGMYQTLAAVIDSVSTTFFAEYDRPIPALLWTPAPNPFREETSIAFGLPTSAAVIMEVYDLTGRRVRSLLEGAFPAGNYAVTWDGLDERGRRTPAGVYFCRLQAGSSVSTQRVVLIP
jgi:hypothetical protein